MTDFHCPARTSSLNLVFVKPRPNTYSTGLCMPQIPKQQGNIIYQIMYKPLPVSCKKDQTCSHVHRNISNYLQNVFSSAKKGIHSSMKQAEIAIDQGNMYLMSQTQIETLHDHVSVASEKLLANHCFHGHYYFHPKIHSRYPCE